MPETDPTTAKKSETVLVTGGGGFLGSAIVKRLVERGGKVRSFSRNFYPKLEAMGVEQIQGDIADRKAVEHACQDVALVLHVAAKPGVWGHYDEYYRTNVNGTENVIAACQNCNVSRLVYTSSPSVVFDGKNNAGVDESAPYALKFQAHYPKTKALAEQKVLRAASGRLSTIILRPHLIWGPEDNHLVPRIIARAKKLRRIGKGRNLVDTTYIDNAAEAHILAADKLEENQKLSGNKYFISQDEPIPVWDMINAILNAAGLAPVKGSVPKNMAWLTGALLEFIYKIFKISAEPPLTRFVVDELTSPHWFDISAAKKDLGYIPKISTQEGLRRLEKWLSHENNPGGRK